MFKHVQLAQTSGCHGPLPDAYECMLYGHLMYYSFYLDHDMSIENMLMQSIFIPSEKILYSAIQGLFGKLMLYRRHVDHLLQ